ncbi:MAG: hypothetical protein M3442_09430 [Chloroflexota bacterium]|nr:hypothetical protein [Chloroflexota bacterium]
MPSHNLCGLPGAAAGSWPACGRTYTFPMAGWSFAIAYSKTMFLQCNEQAALDRETGGSPFAAGRLGTIGDPSV